MQRQILHGTLALVLAAGNGLATAAFAGTSDEVDYSLRSLLEDDTATVAADAELSTDVSFHITPRRRGADPLVDMLFGTLPSYTVSAESRPASNDELYELPRPETGFRYRASLRVKQRETGYLPSVSGHSLGLSYGNYDHDWYHGLDLSVADYADDRLGAGQQWSLGYTTGRRFGADWTAVEPMWLLSLRGDFSRADEQSDAADQRGGDWYLTPSLFWEHTDSTLSAGVEVPVLLMESPEEEPDYRLRATFQHRF